MHSIKKLFSSGCHRDYDYIETSSDCYIYDGNANMNLQEQKQQDDIADRYYNDSKMQKSCRRKKLRPISQTSSGAVSWQDYLTDSDLGVCLDDGEINEESSNEHCRCRYCNISISPAASCAWHERLCGLAQHNSGSYPDHCDLCLKKLRSETHARNHYLYGCPPS